jgi:hypothetical protein
VTFGLETFIGNEKITELARKTWMQLVEIILNRYRDRPIPANAQKQLISTDSFEERLHYSEAWRLWYHLNQV